MAYWKFLAGPLLLLLVFWVLTNPARIDPDAIAGMVADRANGERIFHASGCASCHGEDLAGGLEMTSDFGTFHVPNITPHPEAGIGAWTAADLANAMLHGTSPGGQHYYPAFPYVSYTRMHLQDVVDLKGWLDGFEAVATVTPGHELGFPWNIRRGLGLWKRRYLDSKPVVQHDLEDPVIERGRYLVEGPGHCGECHTPRDSLGGPELSQWLAGAPNPDGEGRVPNITAHEDGLAGWSLNDIAYYLESGFTPEFDTVGGSMVKVQENMARLPPSDREAIAAYLLAVPSRPDAAR